MKDNKSDPKKMGTEETKAMSEKPKWDDSYNKDIIKGAVTNSSMDGNDHKLSKAICELMDNLGNEDTEKVKHKFIMGLYKMCYGNHFSEATAKQWVSCMKNVDGSEGELVSADECRDMHKQYKIAPLSNHTFWDWYVIMNMMQSDYSGVLGDKLEIYIAMTEAYFLGPDEVEGKAWLQLSYKLFDNENDKY